MNEHKEIVEKMAEVYSEFRNVPCRADYQPEYLAEKMLSVVLADIKASPEKYVSVCSECEGGRLLPLNLDLDECPNCNGKGLVPVVNKEGEGA